MKNLAQGSYRAFSIETGGLPLVSTFALLTIIAGQLQGSEYTDPMEPEFLSPTQNTTVAQGRDVHFTCTINHLGPYKVAWIKSDTKMILAIHTHMVTQNPRISVTHNGHNTWKLYISNVQSKDSGTYMCQINTDPMMSQMSHLSVVIPPDITSDSESTVGAPEGGSVELRCTATGTPEPTVSWKRLGARPIVFRDEDGTDIQAVETFAGTTLRLTNLKRHDMGGYLCIASNSVPPSISRTYLVSVYFSPVVQSTSPLHLRPANSKVSLECLVEASPKSLNTWQKGQMQFGSRLMNDTRHTISEESVNPYSVRMNLTITRLKKADFGEYYCKAVNGYGTAGTKIVLKELPQKTTSTTTTTTTTTTTPRTTTTTPLTTVPPKRNPKKPPQDRGKNTNVIEDSHSRQYDYNNVLLHNSNMYGPLNNTLNEYAQRSERQKIRPSGLPRHVIYNSAKEYTLNLVLIIISAIKHCVRYF